MEQEGRWLARTRRHYQADIQTGPCDRHRLTQEEVGVDRASLCTLQNSRFHSVMGLLPSPLLLTSCPAQHIRQTCFNGSTCEQCGPKK